jgi:gamma-glutamylcyclotransferase (GGCT)/AIG2-like uncharacterized protein YtfP
MPGTWGPEQRAQVLTKAGYYDTLRPLKTMTNKLFVYGTLKTETRLLDELVGSGRYRFLGTGSISGNKLKGTPYPAVVKTEGGERVSGELIELDLFEESISTLDEYEGFYPDNYNQSLYTRALVTVAMEYGQNTEAWVYYYNR